MTWLDWHIYRVGCAFERRLGPQEDGVRTGCEKVIERSIIETPQDATIESGRRFEFDLMPHIRQDLASLSSCLRLQPKLTDDLKRRGLDGDADRILDAYFKKTGFSYVDFPTGCFPIGKMFEVRAVFIRSATMMRKDGIVAPFFLPEHVVFDAIFGRAEKLTRQRLSWRLPGMTAVQALVPTDPEYPSEKTKPAVMMHGAGLEVERVLAQLMEISLAAIIYEMEHRGTTKASVVDRVPYGDGALHARDPDPRRSVLALTQLS